MPDECLSSWLARSALALGTDLSSLAGSLRVSWRPWTLDLDRRGPGDLMALLVDRAGVDRQTIHGMTLLPIAKKISGSQIGEKPRWPWILTLGIRGSFRRFGTQYCSKCLEADLNPYFRRSWRLAWHVVCARHSVHLRDDCPNCCSQIEPHRCDPNKRHIAICWRCEADLASCKSENCVGSIPKIQQKLDRELSNPGAFISSRALNKHFANYSRLITGIRRSASTPTATNPSFEHLGEIGDELRRISIRPVSFEMLRTHERYHLLKIAEDLQALLREPSALDLERQFPSDLRRALVGFQCGASATQAEKERRTRTKRGSNSRKPVTSFPRPKHEIERVWRRLKIRANARRND